MTNMSERGPNNLALGALGLAVAAAIGATLGLAFAPQKGEKTREDIRKKAEALAKGFQQKREDIQKNLTDMFGTYSEELEKAYVQIRAKIIENLDDLNTKKKATQANFERLVDETVAEAGKEGKWAKDQIQALSEKIKKEWETFKENLS